MPKAQMWTPITQKLANGIRISTVTGQEWRWSKVRSISRRGWHYDGRVEGSLDPCTGRRLADIPGIVIAAAEKLRAALIVLPPAKAKPGSIHRFTVIQRQGTVIMGGSTYEIRIPPAEVSVRK